MLGNHQFLNFENKEYIYIYNTKYIYKKSDVITVAMATMTV